MMPPRRVATLEDAAITDTDPRLRLGFHLDQSTFADLNIQGIQTELVAPQTFVIDHQTTPVETL
jgi:hypothetical protein